MIVATFLLDAAVEELVLQGLLQLVADGALGVGAAHVEGHLVHALHPVGDLRAAQDEPHLRPVAVADGEVPPAADHVGEVVRRVAQRLLLVLDGLVGGIPDQRVARRWRPPRSFLIAAIIIFDTMKTLPLGAHGGTGERAVPRSHELRHQGERARIHADAGPLHGGGRQLHRHGEQLRGVVGRGRHRLGARAGEVDEERGNRDRLFLATKVGFNRPDVGRSLRGSVIRAEIEGSLMRLGTDRVDLYYAHTDVRDSPLEETLETFDALRREGKLRFIGCSNYRAWRIEQARELSRAAGMGGVLLRTTEAHLPAPGARRLLRRAASRGRGAGGLLRRARGGLPPPRLQLHARWRVRGPRRTGRFPRSTPARTRMPDWPRWGRWPGSSAPPRCRSCTRGCCSPARRSFRW